MTQMPLLDFAFLAFESAESPKHVGGLQIFDLPRQGPRDFVANLVEQLKTITPTAPFNQRLQYGWTGRPYWAEDTTLDMDKHVFLEQLDPPYTLETLLERIEDLHAPKLDRSTALWQLYFFEGLKPPGFAIYFKVHHAYMDGISLSKRALLGLHDKPGKRDLLAFWGSESESHRQQRKNIIASLYGSAVAAGKIALIAPALAKLGLKHGLRLLKLSGRELPVPFTAPRTAFNTPLTPARSVAVADLNLNRVHDVAQHAGVTVNDVLLELCDSAMTRYLQEHDEVPTRPLVAQMPISLRHSDNGQGNQITIALLELGSTETNVIKRLQRIHAHAQHTKDEFLEISIEAAEIYTLLLQSVAQLGESTRLGRWLPPLGNVVISNVAGPEKGLYLAGAPLRAIYPISTIAPGLAINITAFSYRDNLHLGIVAGAQAVPDLSPLVSHLHSALDDLETLMGIKLPTPRKKTVRKPEKSKKKTTRSLKGTR